MNKELYESRAEEALAEAKTHRVFEGRSYSVWHRCNSTDVIITEVFALNGCPTFRCQCGETVFLGWEGFIACQQGWVDEIANGR